MFLSVLLAGCARSLPPDGEGDGEGVPNIPPDESGSSTPLPLNSYARVVSDSLSLRDQAGTTARFIISMPCGGWVRVLSGPSTAPNIGWWNVTYSGPDAVKYTGWASGKYLVAAQGFDAAGCPMVVAGADLSDQPVFDFSGQPAPDFAGQIAPPDFSMVAVTPPSALDAMFARAKLAVGYSYWWGHGAWRTDGANKGTCTGSCPSCTHSDSYGADCSGFVSKVWQVPSASALSVDQHPFSTYNFYNEQVYWTQISRADVGRGDSMVRRVDNAGHMALIESATDPYGSMWLYEARTCAAGVVYNLRTLDSSYRTIRLNGL